MKIQEFIKRLENACTEIISAEEELTGIDSHFGDADHGLTMSKIAGAIKEAADEGGSFSVVLENAASNIMMLNGGSAVPLWNTFFDGLAEAAPDKDEIDVAELKAVFANGYSELLDFSGASVGDKTMMDAFIPACKAIADANGDEANVLAEAYKAAEQGAENSKNFPSKYGRAKSYGTKTIGTPDAGAVSMMYFFKGLAKV